METIPLAISFIRMSPPNNHKYFRSNWPSPIPASNSFSNTKTATMIFSYSGSKGNCLNIGFLWLLTYYKNFIPKIQAYFKINDFIYYFQLQQKNIDVQQCWNNNWPFPYFYENIQTIVLTHKQYWWVLSSCCVLWLSFYSCIQQ